MRLPNQDGGQSIPHEAYDPALKEIFVSNPDMNEVEVYSTVDGHRVGGISIPGPAGLSFTAGDTQLVIGTITPYIYIADPAALHIVRQIAVPASILNTGQIGTTNMPVMPYAMADGTIFLGMGVNYESGSYSFTGVSHLVRYDPSGGTFTPEDPGADGVDANPALSLDGKSLLVLGSGNTGLQLFVYSTTTQAYAASPAQSQNVGFYLAANADGSQFAAVQQNPAGGTVTFFGANLQVENQYTLPQEVTGGAVYSRDGKFLYVMTPTAVLGTFDAQTGQPVGYTGVAVGSIPFASPLFFDADETYHLFGVVQPGGALILNTTQAQASPPTSVALFIGPSTEANPNVGPLAGGTPIQFIPAPADAGGSADGISSSLEAYFGVTPATQDVVAPYPSSSNGGNFLTATAPAGAAMGPVSVVLADANNNTVFLPDAYTYGPHLLRVTPNVASAQGGDTITITAYGLGFFDLTDVRVTVGSMAADLGSAVLNSYASGDYPEQSLTFPVPSGTPGWADITLTTSNGSDTLHRGLQYLQQEVSLPGGPFTFAVYDTVRGHFYLSGNGNSVAVFDPSTQAFLQPLQPQGVSANAVLQGEALTPDASKLVVADGADGTVIIYDLTSNTSTSVNVMLPSDPPSTAFGGVQPTFVATATNNRAFVSIVACVTDSVREIDLSKLTVTPRPDASGTCSGYTPYPQNGASSADGSTIVYAGASPTQPPGPEYVWRYNSASDTFEGPVITADAPWVGGPAAVDADGGVIAASQGILDQRLLPFVPFGASGQIWALNSTGSLAYGGFSGINITDTRNGRLQLALSLPAEISVNGPLATDPTGANILVATQNGVSYFQLSVVPLAVGTVSPARASAGASVTIRGSGFVASTTVTVGGKAAACTETNSETLTCTVPTLSSGPAAMMLSNPDGQNYAFENAFTVQ